MPISVKLIEKLIDHQGRPSVIVFKMEDLKVIFCWGFEMIGEQHVGVGGGEKEQESVWRAGGSLVLGRGPSFIYEAGKKISWRDVTSFWGLVLLERQSRGLVYNVGEKDESGGL